MINPAATQRTIRTTFVSFVLPTFCEILLKTSSCVGDAAQVAIRPKMPIRAVRIDLFMRSPIRSPCDFCLLCLGEFGHAAKDAEGIAAHFEVVVLLGQPPDLHEQIPDSRLP